MNLHQTDESLAEILQQENGSTKQLAFDQLYSRHSEKVVQYFFFSLNRDQEKAKDFMQDLFLKIIEKPELFDTKKNFKSWLYSIASNMCKNEYRKQDTINKHNEHVKTTSSNEAETKKSREEKMGLLINQLKSDYKNVMILRYKFKMSVKEISEIEECPQGTIRSKLFYATKELSEKLKQEDL